MLKFTTRPRKMPAKRAAGERIGDFDEIHAGFQDTAAREQSERCSQCGVPYCASYCPLHNNIPDWLRLTAMGRFEEAYHLSQATNNFPEICGRICPQDRLCEGYCVIEDAGHETVTIGAVEKFLTDKAWESGWVKERTPKNTYKTKVAIIGSGPAGLAAADELSSSGYTVTVFERQDRFGGLLTYGIPGFKLEKHIISRRIDLLKRQGISFVSNVEIGRDIAFEKIQQDFDAILIATGVYAAQKLNIQPKNGLVEAFDYLKNANKNDFGEAVPPLAQGKNVVVIGGGDTAMDCVRTALRQGAKSVRCAYRRDRTNMPGSARETENAHEEGAEFIWLSAPNRFLEGSTLEGVEFVRMEMGPPDQTGRQSVQKIPDSNFTIPADLVITALGFGAENIKTSLHKDLETTDWNTIRVSYPDHATNIQGVFAAGDIVRGASLVVWAIKDGRESAHAIDQYLRAKESAQQQKAAAI